jgi:hypothetical protein
MLLSCSISRFRIFGLLCVLLSLSTHAQIHSERSVGGSDTSKTGSGISKHALYAGTGYGSNMIYLGSTISQNQPYCYGTLAYGFKNKLYASASAVHLTGYNPFLAFYIGSLNYNHDFNSWLDISAGAYRYQVVPSLTDTLFNSFFYGDLTLGVDWRLIYSKISVGGLQSEENQVYFQLRNSRYFQTPEFFHGKADISFDPYINLLFGTTLEVKTSTDTTIVVSSPGRSWKSWKKKKYGTATVLSSSKRFGLMEIDFGLPVAFNTGFMTVEAELDYILPVYNEPDIHGPKGFVFMLSGIFRIF